MAVDRRKLKAISPLSVLLVLIASGVAVYFLLPTKRALLERQIRDADYRNAQTTLKGLPWYERSRDPAFYDLTEIQLERRFLHPDRPTQLEKHLAKVLELCQKHGYKPEFVKEATLALEMHPDPERAYELASPLLVKIPLIAREEVINFCVDKFIKGGKPQRALEVYQEFFGNAITTNQRVRMIVDLLRQNGRPKDALDILEKYVKINVTKLDRETIELAKLEITLLRENGRSEQAFDAIKNLFQASSPEDQKKLFDLLILAAQEANRTTEVLLDIKSKAEEKPDDKELWVLYANTATAANRNDLAVKAWEQLIATEPQNAEYRFKLGQVYEWSAKPAPAFDSYLDALKLLYADAMERLLDLNPGLYRDVELAQAFEEVPQLVRQKGLELQLAKLENKIGNFEIAKKWYEDALNRDPQNVVVLQEYGGLLLSLYQYEQALAVFTRVRKMNPTEPLVLNGLAETYLRMNQFEEAYATLEQLIETSKDNQSLEDFIFLAQTMGKLDGVLKGLYKKIDRKDALPHHYLDLAYFLYVKGGGDVESPDRKECLRVLREGIARFPKDDALRLQTATVLRDRQDYLEAAKILEGSQKLLTTNTTAMELYASMLIQSQRYKEAQAYMRDRIPPNILETDAFISFRASVAEELDNRLEAARLFGQLYQARPRNPYYALNYARVISVLGRNKEAKDVLRPFLADPSPETLRMAAQVFASAREYREAERYQKLYIETQPPEMHKAIGFLADLYFSSGDRIGARQTYEKALDILLADLTRKGRPKLSTSTEPSEPAISATARAQ
jgi:tetratricopeptide (TPR) repeat protein